MSYHKLQLILSATVLDSWIIRKVLSCIVYRQLCSWRLRLQCAAESFIMYPIRRAFTSLVNLKDHFGYIFRNFPKFVGKNAKMIHLVTILDL